MVKASYMFSLGVNQQRKLEKVVKEGMEYDVMLHPEEGGVLKIFHPTRKFLWWRRTIFQGSLLHYFRKKEYPEGIKPQGQKGKATVRIEPTRLVVLAEWENFAA